MMKQSIVISYLICILVVDALDAFDDGKRMTTGLKATAGIWSTYPWKKEISNWSGFGDQVR